MDLATKSMSSLPNAWITTGPLADGNFCQVVGSTGKTYTVYRLGNIYFCDCPSYRFGNKNKNKIPSQWTCKHLRSIEGNENEDIRTSHQPTAITAVGVDVPVDIYVAITIDCCCCCCADVGIGRIVLVVLPF